ncbi:MAG TPA: hypothetical protein PLO07_06120 [Rubrivivax sp.]|nr:hypothetical protein [Rubrivivax sp.]
MALLRCGVDGRLLEVAEHDDGAFAGEFQGGGEADALRGTGDQGDFASEALRGIHDDAGCGVRAPGCERQSRSVAGVASFLLRRIKIASSAAESRQQL